eukprot:CAMPEP_0172191674 /NCGR_PEP_ID=MMETSP1050-20130122/23853_1 /TAXON_ID=233186 /ORGANISM="Cryptomonas curvata, Strain CCAP979/52" /LENGTH=193 /DNA_ID=CAMNT_0012866791 /DNA_START=67 /DNA_END=644 /DNA_ORIENTATION=+
MASRSTSSDNRDSRSDHAPAINSGRASVEMLASDRNGDCEEQVPFLTTSDAPQSRVSQSQFSARCISITISLAKNGLFRQLLLLAFLFSVCWCMIFVFFLPVMDPSDRERLKIPESIAEVRELYTMLGEYRSKHYFAVLVGFAAVYLVKMALALPGSPLFNLLDPGRLRRLPHVHRPRHRPLLPLLQHLRRAP